MTAGHQHGHPHHGGGSLARYAWLSVAAAVTTMAIKGTAAALAGSVAILSDALESSVNLVAALVALVAVRIAERPADDDHPYGHTKAEFFAAAIEGLMVLAAAAMIVASTVPRLVDPRPLDHVPVALAATALATVVNLAVARVVLRAGRRHHSPALVADARHLMTDVWTSAGVVAGVAAVGITGIEVLDPLLALAVAGNVVVAGVALVRRSTHGLMDGTVPAEQLTAIHHVLDTHTSHGLHFHELLTRQAGRRSFMSVHLLVPGDWSVQRAHDLAEELEGDLARAVPGLHVLTHVEPLEDPRSFDAPSHLAQPHLPGILDDPDPAPVPPPAD